MYDRAIALHVESAWPGDKADFLNLRLHPTAEAFDIYYTTLVSNYFSSTLYMYLFLFVLMDPAIRANWLDFCFGFLSLLLTSGSL